MNIFKITLMAAAAALMTATSSCTASKGAATASSIKGSWDITEACGMSTAQGEKQAEITFADGGKVNGNASVNSFFGSYTLNGQKLQLTNVGMTSMMGQHMEIESAVAQALNSASAISVSGNTATVADARGTVVMHLKRKGASAAADIKGSWKITEACGMSTAKGDSQAEITFADGGKVNGNASVNTFFGSYTLNGQKLQLSGIGMTRMMGQSMDVERAVTKALDTAASVSISGSTATVADASGTVVMRLTRK